MKFSIIIPVYNDPRIRKAIASVVAQQHEENVELIVIDGASMDDTLAMVRSFGDSVSTLVSEPDGGIFDALNKGILRASGDVIAFLGADDRYEDPYVLRDVAAVLRGNPVDACYGNLVYVNAEDAVVRYWRSGPFRRRNLYLGWMPPHFALFARRYVYERAGLFDTRYRVAADYDHQLRLFLEHGISVAYLDRVLVRMTLGGNSNRSIRNVIRGNVESLLAWRRHGLSRGLLVPVLKPMRKLIQYVERP